MNVFRISFPAQDNGERKIISGASEELIAPKSDSVSSEGFIFSSFHPGGAKFCIPFGNTDFSDNEMDEWCRINNEKAASPDYYSTSKEEHISNVKKAVDTVSKPTFHSAYSPKIVVARIKIAETGSSASEIFNSLCKAYPSACVFIFSSAKNSIGTWIGASPELLIETENTRIRTMALAGTRPAGTPSQWDSKNIIEQRTVAQFIKDTLLDNQISVTMSSPYTRRAGKIEHICCDIEGTFTSAYPAERGNILKVAKLLSPTPALSGYPREMAIDFIEKNEQPRYYYGGFFGILDKNGVHAYVNLRSGRFITNREIALFAGGGITGESDPEAEWEETERKLSTIMSVL